MVSNVRETLEEHGPFERINFKQIADLFCSDDKRLKDVKFYNSWKGILYNAALVLINPNSLKFDESFKKYFYKKILADNWWNEEFCERVKKPNKPLTIEEIITDESLLDTNGNIDYSSIATCDLDFFSDFDFARYIKVDRELSELEKRTIIFNRINKIVLDESFDQWFENLYNSMDFKIKSKQFEEMSFEEQALNLSLILDERLNFGLRFIKYSRVLPKIIRDEIPYVSQAPLKKLFSNTFSSEFYVLSNPKNEDLNLNQIKQILENTYRNERFQAKNHGITTLITNQLDKDFSGYNSGKILDRNKMAIVYRDKLFSEMYERIRKKGDFSMFDQNYMGCPILAIQSQLNNKSMFEDFFWFQANAYLEFREAFKN